VEEFATEPMNSIVREDCVRVKRPVSKQPGRCIGSRSSSAQGVARLMLCARKVQKVGVALCHPSRYVYHDQLGDRDQHTAFSTMRNRLLLRKPFNGPHFWFWPMPELKTRQVMAITVQSPMLAAELQTVRLEEIIDFAETFEGNLSQISEVG